MRFIIEKEEVIMLKIAVCDDDNAICSITEKNIIDYGKTNNVKIDVEIFNRGEELLEFIESEHSFDLIFLDIELGTTTGIKVGTKIREEFDDHVSKIVFVTSKNGYENELFNIQPLNFLRKPIEFSKLQKCLDLVIKLLDIENIYFEYKKDYDIVKVKIKDILYFEIVKRKTKIVTTSGEDFFTEIMTSVKNRIPKNFVQSHGSFLVNFNKIISLNKDFITLTDNTEIPVSQRNLKNIRTMLLNSEMEKNDVTL